MATLAYAYTGRDATGRIVKGKLEGSSESAVVARMRTMGLSPVSISEDAAGTGLNMELNIGFKKRVKTKDLAVASRQIATMIAAGLSLLRTLTIISEQTENKRLAKAFGLIRSEVEVGTSFSDAIAKQPDIFPPLMLNLVRAGEVGGFLEGSLESIATNYEAEVKLNGKIKSAMTYPVIVLIIACVAVAAMLIFIVPVFSAMFKSLNATLPLPTEILVVLSQGMVYIGPIVVALIIAFVIWWRRYKNDLRVRQFVDPLKLKIPVFGELMKKVSVARLTRNLAMMMGAGVPILRSLTIVGAVANNWVVEQALAKVGESVRQGKTIAEPLSREPLFPAMVTQMIAVGEDSGALEVMLRKVSDFYDQEVEAMTESLTALIEPIMIAIIGVLVGGMIVALYMPIFDIYSHIQGG
ncbi:MAG TPA: type II secretion system F family protein [Galbitalea sp.]|jgi:type IV pilus assembly protein PilC|nr:type II secretion system F family protein [Galbitalea sp.]